jgi:hypothetical protein
MPWLVQAYEDSDREQLVNEPAERRRHDVKQDADDRPEHLQEPALTGGV